jgi:hypothetical protein
VPQGVVKLKKKEFQNLKQGYMTVSEYVTHFMQLSRYAPNDVDTNEKKQECFLNKLNDELAYALEARDFDNFQTMIDKALVLENRRGILMSKREQERQSQQSSNSRVCMRSLPARPTFRLMQQSVQRIPQPTGQGFVTPPRQMISHPNLFQTPNPENQNVRRTPASQGATPVKTSKTCFNYGKPGHFALQCRD